MTSKVLTVVLMVAVSLVALAVSFLFAGLLSLGFRQAAGALFIVCVVGILAADVLWMLRVFRPNPLPPVERQA